MSAVAPRTRTTRFPLAIDADSALAASARLWLLVALAGQWTFLYYIATFYDAATLAGDFAAWSRNPYLLRGYVAGDTAGNLAFAAHVLVAAAVTFAGALQLLSSLRARWPALHRWNGRVFLTAAAIAATSGLGMIWLRGSRANFTAGLATSIDAVLILAFGALAWRAALVRDFAAHRRFALRTYVAANGVWFQRIGMFGWAVGNHAALGMTKHFDGWFDLGWAFGCYLLPLAVLELYLRVTAGSAAATRWVMAAGILFLTALTAFGVYAAYAFVWQPFLLRLGA
ncbi:MAG TPA: DUF2306 domain-containing protein [Rudaea sp.]|nr:DUF2306 domain-containing protein [Rudaea sp.]